MKTVYVVVEVPDDMKTHQVETVIGWGFSGAPFEVGEGSSVAFEEPGDLIDYLGLDVVEMARDAMRGGR